MKHFFKKSSLYTVLFVAFLDLLGIRLVYSLFSKMLFDTNVTLLPSGSSSVMRGFWLGLLLALLPFVQFFSSPIWGGLSDSKGRKPPLLISLGISLIGYCIALCGVFFLDIWLLLLSRVVIGFSSGNISIVQASIADLSSPESKAKNFGLYSMALGIGFTLGPFFGGTLAGWGYYVPFLFTAVLTALNLILAIFFYQETHLMRAPKKLTWHVGILSLKKAFQVTEIRTILLTGFFHVFAWSYFFEFMPVYLISRFQFTSLQLGYFYGTAGAIYALTAGFLIRPFIRIYKPITLFFAGNFLAALCILTLPFVPTIYVIMALVILIAFFVAFVWPSATTIISNDAPESIQGEALGMLASVNAAALFVSPLVSGSLVGKHVTLPMWLGGSIMLLTALIILAVYRRALFVKKEKFPPEEKSEQES